MKFSEVSNLSEYDSRVMGAIFMSNRKTKKECLQRKLFGLPSSQVGFVKRLKTGMILFLFEYEERKLYGVFEATDDGAVNILPDAYMSSGKPFPAQVRFTTLWNCHPLTENQFRDAIKDNYYTDYKFNFGLSRDQVYNLLFLFSSKIIQVEKSMNPMPRKNPVEEFGRPDPVTSKVEKNNRSAWCKNPDREIGQCGRRQSFIQPNSNRLLCDKETSFVSRADAFSEVSQKANPKDPYRYEQSVCSIERQINDTSMAKEEFTSMPGAYQSLSFHPESSFLHVDPPSVSRRSFSGSTSCDVASQNPLQYANLDQLNYPLPDYLPLNAPSSVADYNTLSLLDPYAPPIFHSAPGAPESLTNTIEQPYPHYLPLNAPSSVADYNTLSILDPYVPPIFHSAPGAPESLTNTIEQPYPHSYPSLFLTDDSCKVPQYRQMGFVTAAKTEMFEENMITAISQKNLIIGDHCSSESRGCDDQASLEGYLHKEDEYIPGDENYTLKSDTCHRKESVFSRLSWVPNPQEEHDSFDLQPLNLVDKIMTRLFNKSTFWNQFEASKAQVTTVALIQRNSNPQTELTNPCNFESESESESESKIGSLYTDHGLKQHDQNPQVESAQFFCMEDEVSCKEGVFAGSNYNRFINFKRRRKLSNDNGGLETMNATVCKGDECMSGKQKRRKLVRPSFSFKEDNGEGGKLAIESSVSSRAEENQCQDLRGRCQQSSDCSTKEGSVSTVASGHNVESSVIDGYTLISADSRKYGNDIKVDEQEINPEKNTGTVVITENNRCGEKHSIQVVHCPLSSLGIRNCGTDSGNVELNLPELLAAEDSPAANDINVDEQEINPEKNMGTVLIAENNQSGEEHSIQVDQCPRSSLGSLNCGTDSGNVELNLPELLAAEDSSAANDIKVDEQEINSEKNTGTVLIAENNQSGEEHSIQVDHCPRSSLGSRNCGIDSGNVQLNLPELLAAEDSLAANDINVDEQEINPEKNTGTVLIAENNQSGEEHSIQVDHCPRSSLGSRNCGTDSGNVQLNLPELLAAEDSLAANDINVDEQEINPEKNTGTVLIAENNQSGEEHSIQVDHCPRSSLGSLNCGTDSGNVELNLPELLAAEDTSDNKSTQMNEKDGKVSAEKMETILECGKK